MKIITFKKSILITAAAIVAAGIALGICCSVTARQAYAAEEKVIVIDAGHGGIDAGVRGVKTDVKESDLNLAISKKLKGYFEGAGFKAVLTRSDNGGLYGLSTSGFKMRDMKKRKQIIEENSADMVISIHQNKCPIPSRRGGTVFFDKGRENGKRLAESIQNSLNGMEECASKNEALAGDYYMLKCTENPSVIVECGFLSNTEDEKLLISEDYQSRLAYAVFKGAVSYYS
ncbi:MAG: N-acetylmuramoyl-L-alanine amidase [Clostridia bacterium]|nr:N-acetylmuramoyl-L-alanine amidase [Clostridia bacterium]